MYMQTLLHIVDTLVLYGIQSLLKSLKLITHNLIIDTQVIIYQLFRSVH